MNGEQENCEKDQLRNQKAWAKRNASANEKQETQFEVDVGGVACAFSCTIKRVESVSEGQEKKEDGSGWGEVLISGFELIVRGHLNLPGSQVASMSVDRVNCNEKTLCDGEDARVLFDKVLSFVCKEMQACPEYRACAAALKEARELSFTCPSWTGLKASGTRL